jgi:two-component system, NarL family, nitrate/nitrite response regulator NarL
MASGPPPANAQLTDREQYIVALLAAGHPASMIAGLLGVSTRVVENHKRRIYRKLAVSSQSHLAARAATLGLVGRPQVAVNRLDRARRMPLVVVHAANGPVRHDIEAALLAAHLPFVVDPAERNPSRWSTAGTTPSILVVADPVTRDWSRSVRPGTLALLVRSVPMSRDEVLGALAHGVVGVVAATQVSAVLVPALQLAISGHLAFEPVTGAALAAADIGWGVGEAVPELTVREGDILRSIAHGDTVRQTARSLGIAEKTVENTQSRLFRKLGAHNRSGALTTAHALGLIELFSNTYGGAAGLQTNLPVKG